MPGLFLIKSVYFSFFIVCLMKLFLGIVRFKWKIRVRDNSTGIQTSPFSHISISMKMWEYVKHKSKIYPEKYKEVCDINS